jgi:guanine deaminase
MSGKLDDDDRRYLRMAVELSRSYRDDPRRWPFGAVVVGQGKVVGRGFNQVMELPDPSAHAEIMALRAAACYWATVPRVVFAATSRDLAGYDFQDLVFYTELGLPAESRSIREDADREEVRREALLAVQDWAQHR